MTPVLAPLSTVLARSGIDAAVVPPAIQPPGSTLFAVVRDGTFAGRRYVAGEVLVCRVAEGTGPVVLAARGPGRVMLGRVDGTRLLGDANEPCSPERWSVAGRVERVLLASAPVARACQRFGRATSGAVRGLEVDRPAPRPVPPAPVALARRPAPVAQDQLSLFGKAA